MVTATTPASTMASVVAPAGSVGIVLGNVIGGMTFVHSVKEHIPLSGIVEVGDFLLSIDEIDCQGMSALDASRVITNRGRRFERRWCCSGVLRSTWRRIRIRSSLCVILREIWLQVHQGQRGLKINLFPSAATPHDCKASVVH